MATHVDRASLISLIMTVRDGARYIAQALESVRAQTFADWELVLWDDGSTDDTLAIARAYALNEPRIRVHASEPLGRRRALVEAHRLARGRYLGWIDADDWLAPEALARTYAVLQTSRCDLVYTDHIVVGPAGERRGLGKRARIPYGARRLLIDFMSFHFRLFSREVFDRAGGIDRDLEIAIDYDLCLRISEHGRITHLAEPLYFYRHHDQQLSSRQRAAQIAASATAIRRALARRKLSCYELAVDLKRGRFRLVRVAPPIRPRPAEWLRIAAATAMPRVRASRAARHPPVRSIGYWPAPRASVYCGQLRAASEARGVDTYPLGGDLASLMRAVWTGRAGDTLLIRDVSPLLEAAGRGDVLASGHLFVKTLDHALARGMRLVWTSPGLLTTHPRHREHEAWIRRALAARCQTIVTHWRPDVDRLRALGAPLDRTVFVRYPSLVDDYPVVSQRSARVQLGLVARDTPTLLYLGGAGRQDAAGDLVLAGDVDGHPPREVALHVAAADLVVLPAAGLTCGALVLAMAMAKPIVAPALPGITEVVGEDTVLYPRLGGARAHAEAVARACGARQVWGRVGHANLDRVRGWSCDAVVAAVVCTA